MLFTVEVADLVELFDLKGEDRKAYGKIKFRMAQFYYEGRFEDWYFASDVFDYLNITEKEGLKAIKIANCCKYILVLTKEQRLQEVQVINRDAIGELDDCFDTKESRNLSNFIEDGKWIEDKNSFEILYSLPADGFNYIK